MSLHKYYKISDDGTLIRLNQFCPRCGPGYFMSNHYDRLTCGNCSYTDFKKRTQKKAPEAPTETKPAKPTKAAEPKAVKKKRKKR